MPWRSGGQSAAEQKRAERDLAAIKTAGLVSCRRHRVKTLLVKLTDRGDQIARALVGLPGIDAGLATLAELHRLAQERKDRGTTLHASWLPETDLNDGRGWGDGRQQEFAGIQDLALPALARGWLEWNSDTEGHVYYRVIPHDDISPTCCGELPGPEAILWDFYKQGFQETWAALVENNADCSDLGAIPLPASMGALPALPAARVEAGRPGT